MRRFALAVFGCLLLTSCSKAPPPSGRWEGFYESADTMVAARLEIEDNGLVSVSADDVTNIGGATTDERTSIGESLFARLAIDWDKSAPHAMDFDGKIFRNPGGISHQIAWDSNRNIMTLYVYLGLRPAILVPLHAVSDFANDPWTH